MKPPVPVISVRGKPFERGKQYGLQTKGLIEKNLKLYFDLWSKLWGAKRPEVLKHCSSLGLVIGEYDAEILEEMQGIAKGASLSLEEIVALNARYEMVFAQSAVAEAGGGCTSIATMPVVNKNGHTILGQNWDYKERFQGLSIILEEEPDGKPNIVTHTEAGLLIHKSMNSAGLGICINALVSSRDKFG